MRKNALGVIVLALIIVFPFSANADTLWSANGLNIYNTNTGNVGIGTTNPLRKLDIEKGHIRLGQVAAPTAPTVAVGAAGVLTGNYYYRITYITALGETETGTASALITPSAQQVNLSGIPVSSDSAVTARKIYRTTAGGSTVLMKLVTTINDNTTTTYTDNISDISLGVSQSRVNTTGGIIYNGVTRAGIIDNATTAIGMNALRVNTGYNNSAMGINALYRNTTGYNNSAIGVNALFNTTTGYNNSAIGVSTFYNNTTGYNNSAIGVNALYNNTTGYYNSAMGVNALFGNTTGYYNSAIGVNAGRFITGGTIANQTSNASVYLGGETKAFANGDSNEIIIGHNTTGLGSNTVILGNSSITKTALQGNVGIGTTAPGSKLDVNGNANINGNIKLTGNIISDGDICMGVCP